MAAMPSLPQKDRTLHAGGLTVSEAGQRLILDFEVGGGEPYYVRYLQRPTWPEGASGVTIGVGYDLGYNTREQIARDWAELPAVTLARLQACAGMKGTMAKLKTREVRDIIIPWTLALKVYQSRTIPRFAEATRRAYPGVETLHPSAQGAYLSWVFNRGEGITSSARDLEKRLIRRDTPSAFPAVPGHFLASQRLWIGTSNGAGLCRRRQAEAALIQSTLP
jgi:GH24 family phage-related lysozyme (muramidase)